MSDLAEKERETSLPGNDSSKGGDQMMENGATQQQFADVSGVVGKTICKIYLLDKVTHLQTVCMSLLVYSFSLMRPMLKTQIF